MNSMLEYKGYHAAVNYDADDDLFVGEVFGLTDSLNFHGTSIEELKQSFHDSVDNYLELCRQIGKEPEKEYKGAFNIRITPALHRQISLLANQEKISLNQYVANALAASVKSRENNMARAK